MTSPHAGLQVLLSQLGRLSPRRRAVPTFSDRDAAEHVIAISASATGTRVALAPIWAIDHENLVDSEIVAWTVAPQVN